MILPIDEEESFEIVPDPNGNQISVSLKYNSTVHDDYPWPTLVQRAIDEFDFYTDEILDVLDYPITTVIFPDYDQPVTKADIPYTYDSTSEIHMQPEAREKIEVFR